MKHSRGIFLSLSLAIAASYSSLTFSQGTGALLTGGQVCQPMKLSTALKGLQWRSEGAINEYFEPLWVVCSAQTSFYSSRVDAFALVVNRNRHSEQIQCLIKVTAMSSASTVRSQSKTLNVPAEFTAFLGVEGIFVDENEAISISCKLPPGTGVSGIAVETF